ncbi:ABC-type glycerol-3-phosphate transport system permease component [Thermocatellispora tengchongensis]|uniref:ABC-type glycerol-3-phosphate transport system permease component n=1 Tax=Thermocatellispora tengchongensis TaxID=1073253 RepID=A0A840PM54_9ACTN|nr:carbohydrate ABC transporter permease [Thermocatellispora tengchongensis]MBB5140029.1 ABC-type glycerol-3-phosphate transport system permease component [Thermocatellispora tengchongensis]
MARPRVRRSAAAVLGALAGLAFAVPLLWAVTSSLRENEAMFRYISEPSWRTLLPSDVTLANYAALVTGDFGRAILNSIVVALATVVLGLVISAAAAFGLAAVRFRGQGVLFGLVVLSFLIPFDAIAIPLATLFRDWSLQNTYAGLILPGLGHGLAIFLLRQFFLAIPAELVEAARIDGLGWFGVFARIYLPLSRPALVGAGMTLFIFQWQAYVWPLLIGTDTAHQLGPIALANMRGQFTIDYGQLFAGSVVLTVIPLIVIMRYQRHFTQSISTTGLK